MNGAPASSKKSISPSSICLRLTLPLKATSASARIADPPTTTRAIATGDRTDGSSSASAGGAVGESDGDPIAGADAVADAETDALGVGDAVGLGLGVWTSIRRTASFTEPLEVAKPVAPA